jgi:hypothetical protein
MIITEAEFRAEVLKYRGTFHPMPDTSGPVFVTGPGRSGAIASVYASHFWGAAFLPFGEIPDCEPGNLLVVDTATKSGRTLRGAAVRYPGCRSFAFYDESSSGLSERVYFWYEGRANDPAGVLTPPRATGRTGRMLKRAEELALAGRAVYVICFDPKAVEQAFGRDRAQRLGIKFESVSSPGNLDLERVKLLGAHPNCVVLVDHCVIERRFAAILEELHRYDAGRS